MHYACITHLKYYYFPVAAAVHVTTTAHKTYFA